MFTLTTTSTDNKRVVITTANSEAGPYTSRLYVDAQGDRVPTLIVRKAKTLKGAIRQADQMVGR